MAVDSVTSNSAGTINSAIQQATGGSHLGEQDFLKLLTTQLTNQDPLAPQDQTAMLAQLAQFSTVEGVNNLQANESRLQATQLLGKNVDAYITKNGTPTYVSGVVSNVRFASDGIHLSIQGSTADVLMTDLNSVSP